MALMALHHSMTAVDCSLAFGIEELGRRHCIVDNDGVGVKRTRFQRNAAPNWAFLRFGTRAPSF
jgi:hypothetical protein